MRSWYEVPFQGQNLRLLDHNLYYQDVHMEYSYLNSTIHHLVWDMVTESIFSIFLF
jgi:hypothetical protein